MQRLLLCVLLSLVSFNHALSFASLKRRAVFDEQADAATTCQLTSDSFYTSRVSAGYCPKSAKSTTCTICGPSSVQVPQGGQVTVSYSTSCTANGWQYDWQNWAPGHGVTISVPQPTAVLSFIISASTTATIGTLSSIDVNYCFNDNTFAGESITVTVVAAGSTTTAAPATTSPATTHATTPAPVTTQATTPAPLSCPAGYDSSASDLTSPPDGNTNWCPSVSASTSQVCKAVGNWQTGGGFTMNVGLTVACTPTKTGNWVQQVAPGATLGSVSFPNNIGTTWTLTEPQTQLLGGQFIFTSGWCCPDGPVFATVSVNSP